MVLTGADGSGKRMVFDRVEARLRGAGVAVVRLDGRDVARLPLRGLIGRIAGGVDATQPVEALLAPLGAGPGRHVVLVDGAQSLGRDALEFFGLVAMLGRGWAQPMTVVFAARPASWNPFGEAAGGAGLIQRRFMLAGPAAAPPRAGAEMGERTPLARPQVRAPGPRGGRALMGAVVVTGLLAAAGAAAAVWQFRPEIAALPQLSRLAAVLDPRGWELPAGLGGPVEHDFMPLPLWRAATAAELVGGMVPVVLVTPQATPPLPVLPPMSVGEPGEATVRVGVGPPREAVAAEEPPVDQVAAAPPVEEVAAAPVDEAAAAPPVDQWVSAEMPVEDEAPMAGRPAVRAVVATAVAADEVVEPVGREPMTMAEAAADAPPPMMPPPEPVAEAVPARAPEAVESLPPVVVAGDAVPPAAVAPEPAPVREPEPAVREAVAPAPVPEPGSEPVVREAAAPAGDPALARVLMRRGDALLEIGDISAARLAYARAATVGSAVAATAVGRTYDPGFIALIGGRGIAGDVARAAQWYRRGVEMGDAAAAMRLRELGEPR